ncbi:hypothetical protein ACIGHG_09485 [Bacillus sp. NPDC077411]|uniref:hypothetical protein n=1 Tax=Bacillus sp. NPDC077411 TaxID=3363947 RepID=UPI0037CB8E11
MYKLQRIDQLKFGNIGIEVNEIEADDWIISYCVIVFLCFTYGTFNVIFAKTD